MSRLPLAPHVDQVRALPTEEMVQESVGIPLRFRILDKRTLQVYRLDVPVGASLEGPWGGELNPTAYVPDLLIHRQKSLHGPEGHVNPAAWVVLSSQEGTLFHEGWAFSRDMSLNAWDHHRYDLTFLGPVAQLAKEGDIYSQGSQ
ncbi:MAG: hypothetical protein HQL52_10895 [Magnetococcales bacterium]|nr:hypothetical protein [Magnetococcales bacterium]